MARLRVSDFNPDSGTLHIRKTKTNKEFLASIAKAMDADAKN